MSVVAVASVKGSPGVTTVALALASWWPRPVVVVEGDPAGGDLALRLGIAEDPGLVGLAAARRRRSRSDVLEHYSQESPLGISVVPAPAGAHQSAAAVSLLAGLLESRLTFEVDVLLDVGRLDQFSPAQALAAAADSLIWVCRPQLGDLAHLSAAVEHRRSQPGRFIVLNGAGPYPAEEVATTLGVTVLGHLPADPGGVTALWQSSARAWGRCALGRASRDLAHDLDAALAPLCESPVDAGSPSHSVARKVTVPPAGTVPDVVSAETTGPHR